MTSIQRMGRVKFFCSSSPEHARVHAFLNIAKHELRASWRLSSRDSAPVWFIQEQDRATFARITPDAILVGLYHSDVKSHKEFGNNTEDFNIDHLILKTPFDLSTFIRLFQFLETKIWDKLEQKVRSKADSRPVIESARELLDQSNDAVDINISSTQQLRHDSVMSEQSMGNDNKIYVSRINVFDQLLSSRSVQGTATRISSIQTIQPNSRQVFLHSKPLDTGVVPKRSTQEFMPIDDDSSDKSASEQFNEDLGAASVFWEQSTIDDVRHALIKRPPLSMITKDRSYHRMVSFLMQPQGVTIEELSQLSGVTYDQCQSFLQRARKLGILHSYV